MGHTGYIPTAGTLGYEKHPYWAAKIAEIRQQEAAARKTTPFGTAAGAPMLFTRALARGAPIKSPSFGADQMAGFDYPSSPSWANMTGLEQDYVKNLVERRGIPYDYWQQQRLKATGPSGKAFGRGFTRARRAFGGL